MATVERLRRASPFH